MVKNICFVSMVMVMLLVFLGFSSISQANEVVKWDFESEEFNGWSPRGDNVSLEIVSEAAYNGDFSLFTKGRNNDWNGPSINLQDYLIIEEEYNISTWVKIPEGQKENELIMTIEKYDGENNSWDRVAGPIKVNDNNWIELSGDYTINSGYERFTLYIESPDETLEYYIDDVSITMVSKTKKEVEEDIKSLFGLYENDFLIGTAVEPYQLSGEHARLLLKHFNSITAENVMKPQSLQPEEGSFTFSAADTLVSFAEKNDLQIRGHTLLWHQQSPEWFFLSSDDGDLTRDELLDRLKIHIQTVVSRYKGKIYAWDVVNEVIDPSSRDTNGMRKNMWYQYLGPEYIEKAFEYAYEADPDAKLFINDYSLVSDSNKREYMYKLVKSLKEKGVPIDGIGMQVHINIYDPRIMEIEETIEKFASLGVELHITELDMSVYRQDFESYDKASAEILVRQGYRYKELFELFKKYSDNIGNVTFWGMADDHTWLTSHPVERNNWPLLFDENLKAKYAYWGLIDPNKLPDISNEEKRVAYNTEAVRGTVKIDGVYDEIWDKANAISTDIMIAGNAGAKAKVKTMWDENNLYIYAEVYDPELSKENSNTYEQDSIEIFIDENNHKSYFYEEDDSQYRVNYDNEQSFDPNPEREGFITATRLTDTGYIVEASIKFLTIKPVVGQSIGFDFQVNDDQGAGRRESIAIWNDSTGNSWQDPSGLGNLIFVE